MKVSSEGVCRFCLKTFSGSTMGRHLSACSTKKERDAGEAAGAKKVEKIFRIKVLAYGEYWLHLEMMASSTLADLDGFLRDIWLECCGHLSQFTIHGGAYVPEDEDPEDIGAESMEVQLGKVLRVKDKFEYEYDFGSTTHLKGQIVSERDGTLKEKVRILARNRIPEVACMQCGKPATRYCTDCEAFYCRDCLPKHGCEEGMALPLVNSPRMGVCGYTGEQDPDDFDRKDRAPDEAVKKRGLPEALIKYREAMKNKDTEL